MSRVSGTERASRSSSVITRISPGPARCEGLTEPGPGPVGPGQVRVDVDAVWLHAERGKCLALGGEVLGVGRAAGVSDEHAGHRMTAAIELPSPGIFADGCCGNRRRLASWHCTNSGRPGPGAPLRGSGCDTSRLVTSSRFGAGDAAAGEAPPAAGPRIPSAAGQRQEAGVVPVRPGSTPACSIPAPGQLLLSSSDQSVDRRAGPPRG